MKTRHAWGVYLYLGCVVGAPAIDQASFSKVIQRGPHHRVWEITHQRTTERGRVLVSTNRFVELGTGLNYDDGGTWKESKAEIVLTADGASALAGQHKVHFAANLNSVGAIDMTLPDGQRMRSQVVGLSYYERSTGRSVLIGQVQNSIGLLRPPNQVIYPDAFSGVKANVRYTYTKAGIEQDVILLEQLPSPSSFGMGHGTTVLEVLTEIVDAPVVEKAPARLPARLAQMVGTDEHFKFGPMRMPTGKAFFAEDVTNTQRAKLANKALPVTKSIEHSGGRTFLIEAIKHNLIRNRLSALPLHAALKPDKTKVYASRLPAVPALEKQTKRQPMRMASVAMPERGFVLDYELINTELEDYTFRGDTTYLISGIVNICGTATFEGGTVLKYSTDDLSAIQFYGAIVCNTSELRPAVFTTRNDNTVGEPMATGTNLTKFFQALSIATTGNDLKHIRVRHSEYAVHGYEVNLRHSQIVHCDVGLYTEWGPFNLANVLMYDVTRPFSGTTYNGKAVHVTVDQCALLTYDWSNPAESSITFTNCIINNATQSGDVAVTLASTVVRTNASPFIASGGGLHYLNEESGCLDAGTTNIDPQLRLELQSLTTTAPLFLSGQYSLDIHLEPMGYGDSGAPDLGYHYPVVDYIVSGLINTEGSSCHVWEGVRLAYDYQHGAFAMQSTTGGFFSHGSPSQRSSLVRASILHEDAAGQSWISAPLTDWIYTESPEIRLRFTDLYDLGGGGLCFYAYNGYHNSQWEFSHCRFYSVGGHADLYGEAGGIWGFTNSLFESSRLVILASSPVALNVHNNLFKGGSLTLSAGSYNATAWRFFDNMFCWMALTTNGFSVTNSHNAFIGGTPALGGSGVSWEMSGFPFVAGPLGAYYQPEGSTLLNAGSRSGSAAGLFHFTSRTNQVKDGPNSVSVGLHYVAVDANGQPLDFDNDENPDFLEDLDGNGTSGTGESPWNLGYMIGPGNQTVNPGGTAVFNVTWSGGNLPVTYQWHFNGQGIAGASGSSLVILNTLPSRAGSYSVVATYGSGALTSGVASLSVRVPPSMASNPTNKTVPSGTNVQFSATALGTGPLRYQWLFNGTNIAGATASTLTVSNVTVTNAGAYSVSVTNLAGSTTSLVATLVMVGIDRVVLHGVSPEIRDAFTACLGSPLAVRAMPAPAGTSYPSGYPVWTWVSQPAGSSLSAPASGSATAAFTPTNTGMYVLQAACGKSSATFTLTNLDSTDPDYNGLSGCQELLNGPARTVRLGLWQFDTPSLAGLQGQVPLSATNVVLGGGWSILGASLSSKNGPASLVYAERDANAPYASINCREGSIRFWFKPDWASTGTNNGTGPLRQARLIEIGAKGTGNGWWGLMISSNGTQLSFGTQTNDVATLRTNVNRPILWRTGDWHQVVLTYSQTNSALYVDGAFPASGTGVRNWPGASVRAQGFRIGSDQNRTNWAQGTFDNLETFNYPLSSNEVSAYHQSHPRPRATNTCLLAPIAFYVSVGTTMTNGQIATSTNGAGNGNFGWLSWNGNGTPKYLAEALTNWTKSAEFRNDIDHSDTTLSVGDWISGNTGVSGSDDVKTSLNWLTNSASGISVVLWHNPDGSGSGTRYKAAAYARVVLLDYNLSGNEKWLKYRYLGPTDCDSISNRGPAVYIANPTNTQIFNTPSSVPITAMVHDPEDGVKSVEFYSNGTNLTGTSVYSIGVTNKTTNRYTFTWISPTNGSYNLTAVATDALKIRGTSSVVSIIVNRPPAVNAGSDRTVVWSATNTLTLNGTVTDDGRPGGAVTATWSRISGPNAVTFNNSNNVNTTVTFGTNGVYTLRLTTTDGAASSSDDMVMTVNRRPTITIVNPTNGSVFVNANSLGIDAVASDPDGVVTSVVFDVGGDDFWGMITNPPYSVLWTNPPLGVHAIIATATDNSGLIQVSEPVFVTFNQGYTAPVVNAGSDQTIVWPLNHATLAGSSSGTNGPPGSSLTNTWSKVSGPGNVSFNSVHVTNTTATFSTNGEYTLMLTAHNGVSQTFDLMTVKILRRPTITLTTPVNGAISNAPTDVFIAASAGDLDGIITQIQFFSGTTLLGTVDSFNFSMVWTNPSPGIYSLTARATDNHGLGETSAPVVLTVNQVPSVNAGSNQVITWPINQATLAGTATDDGRPTNGRLVVVWSMVSGPGTVALAPTNTTSSTATFSTNGVYTLRLQASDGYATNSSTVVVTVNLPPSVTLTSPTDGAIYPATPTNLTITAEAYDDGTISQVEFFAGTNSLGVDWAFPYSIVWSNMVDGNYSLTAKATENYGISTTSSVVNIIVQSDPMVSILVPTNGHSMMLSPTNIAITALAASLTHGISHVQFFESNNIIGVVSSFPYTNNWRPVFGGFHTLTARAVDTAGRSATSGPVTVYVNHAPTVTLTSPTNLAIYTTPSVNILISANATDIDGTISQVEFFHRTNSLGVDSDVPYSLVWSNVPTGTHHVYARATDNFGAQANTEASMITVLQPNAPPFVFAGSTQTIRLTNTTLLHGVVHDDGLPLGNAVALDWQRLSGPGTVAFSDSNSTVTRVVNSVAGTNVYRLRASDGQFTVSSDTTIIVLPQNRAPLVDAGSNFTIILPGMNRYSTSVMTDELPIYEVATVTGPISLDYFAPSNSLIATVNWPNHSFALIDSNGVPSTFATKNKTFSGGDNTYQEILLATARSSAHGFSVGDTFAGGDAPGVLMRISSSGELATNWVMIPGESIPFRGGLCFDETGVWGGDLLVGTTSGRIWRISASRAISLVASNNQMGGIHAVLTVPNDAVYGPMAGTILAGITHDSGSSSGDIFAVSTNGTVTHYDWSYEEIEGIVIVPPQQNLFASAVVNSKILACPWTALESYVGDLLLADYSGFIRVKWTGTTFVRQRLLTTNLYFEGVTFAPIDMPGLPLIPTLTLTGSVFDDGLPLVGLPPVGITNVAWQLVSGNGSTFLSDTHQLVTPVRLHEPGQYVFRLTADDTELSNWDEVTVTVIQNEAPMVYAGTNQTITGNAATLSSRPVLLSGTATDDGYPSNTLIFLWSKESGDGTVTFVDGNALNTTAIFSQAGSYRLRLTASDGQARGISDVTITIAPTARLTLSIQGVTNRWQADTLPIRAVLTGAWNDTALPGSNVVVVVTGANAQTLYGTSGNSDGSCCSYVGVNAGDDVLVATTTVNGVHLVSPSVEIHWQAVTELPCGTSHGFSGTGPHRRYIRCYSGTSLELSVTDYEAEGSGPEYVMMTVKVNGMEHMPAMGEGTATRRYNIINDGLYLVEFSFPWTAVYNLHARCHATFNVFNGATRVTNYSTVDIGTRRKNQGLQHVMQLQNPLMAALSPVVESSSANDFFASTANVVEGETVANLLIDWTANSTNLSALITIHGDHDDEYWQPLNFYVTGRVDQAGDSPRVTLTSPTNGQVFGAPPGTVVLSANASQGSGIQSVTFVADGTSLGEVSSPPYTLVWSNTPLGQHSLYAIATASEMVSDEHNDEIPVFGYSSPVTITVANTAITNRPSFALYSEDVRLTNFTTIDLGATLLATPVTRTFVISNLGTWPLNLFQLSNNGDFTVSSPPASPIEPGGWTALGIQFNASAVGSQFGTISIPSDDPTSGLGSHNPFVLNFTATASPTGVPPSITISAPANGSQFSIPESIAVTASATASGASISRVEFLVTTNNLSFSRIGRIDGASGPYVVNWKHGAVGRYSIVVQATDTAGRISRSSPVNVTIISNTPPVATDDEFVVYVNSSQNFLNVLANDSDAETNTLKITALTHTNIGTAMITNDGRGLAFIPPHDSYGSSWFAYTISDGHGGTHSAWVLVRVEIPTPPTISITSPSGSTTFGGGVAVTIAANAQSSQGSISRVDFFADSEYIGSVAGGSSYSMPWDTIIGVTHLSATAYDTLGQMAEHAVSITVTQKTGTAAAPMARFDNLTNVVAQVNGQSVTGQIAVVREGLFVVRGSARDQNNGASSYRLRLRQADGSLLKDLTPQPIHTAVQNGPLFTNDFTMLRNGVYQLELIVSAAGRQASTNVTFALDSELKVGQFSFSQQDMVIPVAGLPLSVIRTYNTLKTGSGDFGNSWTYAIHDLEMTIDEDRQPTEDVEDEDGQAQIFSLRVGGGRDVTLTLPDGRRTTFAFYLEPGPCNSGDNVDLCAFAKWVAPPDVYYTLTPLGDNKLIALFGNYWWAADSGAGYENFDFPGFLLTARDGTQYRIDREDLGEHWFFGGMTDGNAVHAYGQGRLTKITQRTGDTIAVARGSIMHTNAAGQLTRQVSFQRDASGRIVSIVDPNSTTNTPTVKYEYDFSGNLVRVSKLKDRTAKTYETTTYLYGNPNFPHYITEIRDARGITPLRTLYDNDGRIIGTVDAFGFTNRVVHGLSQSLTNHSEVIWNRSGHATTHYFDSRGNVTLTIDALGKPTFRTHDGTNNLTSMTDALSNTTFYAYDAAGNLTKMVDALLRTNHFSYDTNGNLLTQTDPLGNVTSNRYDGAGLLTNSARLNAQGQVVDMTSHFFSSGQLVETRNFSNQVVSALGYDTAGNLTNLTDANGFNRGFRYDANGNQTNSFYVWAGPGRNVTISTLTTLDAANRVMQTIDANGNTNRAFYNAIGKVAYSIDKLGNTNSFHYDARANLIETKHPDGTVTRTVYDDDARPVLTTDRNGITGTRVTYDDVGRVTTNVCLKNVLVSITADPNNAGQVRSVIAALGTALATNATEYYDNGWVKARTGPEGGRTSYEYWTDGQVKTVTDPLTNVTTYSYDEAGRQTVVRDAMTNETQFMYDALGRMVKAIYADTSYSSNAFNALGQRIGQIDQAGLLTRFDYTVAGQLKSVTKPPVMDPQNPTQTVNPQWLYEYDAYSRLSTITDPKGRTNSFCYDALGRQLTRKLPLGQTETNVFNTKGQLWKKVDFKGQTTEFVYDKFGRVRAKFYFDTGASSPSNAVCYQFNALGQLAKIVERSGADATTNACDGYAAMVGFGGCEQDTRWAWLMRVAGRYARPMLALGLIWLAWSCTPQEVKRRLVEFYLGGGWRLADIPEAEVRRLRLPSLWWRFVTLLVLAALIGSDPHFARLFEARAQCVYPANVSTETTRITEFGYDFDGRLAQVNAPEGVINYGYDLATGRHTSTCTTNSEVAYGYDKLGRLKTVTALKHNGVVLSKPEVTTYTYTKVGSRETVTLPNGVVSTWHYDNLKRLTNLTHTIGTRNLASYSYLLNATGRRTNAIEVLKQEDGSYLTNTLAWQYDGMYRLTNEVSASSVTAGTFSTHYQHDEVGNRLKKIRKSGSTDNVDYNYNDNDQLLQEVSTLNGRINCAYDANGSLTGKTNSSGTVTYDYNLMNKMRAVTAGGTTTSLLYNDSGIRVRSMTGGSATHYLIDANNHTGYAQVLEELTTPGTSPKRSYVLGDDVLKQFGPTTNAPSYLLYDGHGSTRQLANTSATVTSHYNYDAYGAMLGNSSTTSETSLLYCGEQMDSTLGMYNLRARFYDTGNGRFNSMDSHRGSSREPKSLHKYLYAGNDSVNASDPSGYVTLSEIGISVTTGVALELFNAAVIVSHIKAIKHGLFPTTLISASDVPTMHKELGSLCSDVYHDQSKLSSSSWLEADLGALGLQDPTLFNSGSFFARLYKHSSRNAYALAFRGTQDSGDWGSNITQSGFGLAFSSQYDQALALADEVTQAIRGADLTMTGHSLGGGLASAAALEVDRPAVTFNAAGLNVLTRVSLSGNPYSGSAVNYSVDGEILTGLQNNTFTPEAFGQLYRLKPAPEDAGANPVTLHGMDVVNRALAQ